MCVFESVCMLESVCVCVCVRACVRARVCVCVCVLTGSYQIFSTVMVSRLFVFWSELLKERETHTLHHHLWI